MQHFDLTSWVDFVRGVSPRAESETMVRHLAEGCESCSRMESLAGRIQTHASVDIDPPAAWVSRAKAVFAAEQRLLLLPRLASRLFFANEQLSLAGVRRVTQPARDLICSSGDYRVELHVECEPESVQVALVGQAVNTAASGAPLKRAPVVLLARGKVIAKTETNEFGEFCLASE